MPPVGFDELLFLLLAVIPEGATELRQALRDVTKDWWNVAPELRANREYWLPMARVLEDSLGSPPYDLEWKQTALNVYNAARDGASE
jgi:hypothetical protein